MVGGNEQVAKTERETSPNLPVDFQAPLLSIGQLTVVFHASGADAAGPIQDARSGHLDGSFVDAVIAAGRDDICRDARGILRRWESKKLIALAGLPLIGRNPSEILWKYARSLAGTGDRRRRIIAAQVACNDLLGIRDKEEGHVVTV